VLVCHYVLDMVQCRCLGRGRRHSSSLDEDEVVMAGSENKEC